MNVAQKTLGIGALVASFVHLRNALIKMIDAGQVQIQKELVKLAFQGN